MLIIMGTKGGKLSMKTKTLLELANQIENKNLLSKLMDTQIKMMCFLQFPLPVILKISFMLPLLRKQRE